MKKSNFSLVIDMLKLAYNLDKTSIFLTAALSSVRAVKPYIGILLSAYVIDGLSSGAKLETLILTALAGVAAIFLLSLVEGALNKQYDVHVEICVHKFNMELSKKTLTMDFEQLDSPLVNDIRNRIKIGNNWGAGFYSVFWQLGWLLNCLFGVIASAVVLEPLLQSGGVFSNWAASASLVALIMIMLVAAFLNAKVFDKRTFKLMDESAKYRSYFYHFLFGGIDYKAGKDFRIYDASQMLKKYCFADEGFRLKFIGKFSSNAGIQGSISGFANGILQGGSLSVRSPPCHSRRYHAGLRRQIRRHDLQLRRQPDQPDGCLQPACRDR